MQHQKNERLSAKSDSKNSTLGNNAEFSSPPPKSDKSRALRADRYRLQSVARNLILAKGKDENLVHAANYHRTAKCTHVRFSQLVSVHKSKAHNKAFYGGLVACANAFTCPVCAAKIQERRRLEIAQGFDWSYANGQKVIMVTFTFPHYQFQKLSDLLTRQSDAYRRLRLGAPWVRVKKSIGYIGLIRALEVTHGVNGWHPHTHEAWIVDKHADVEQLKARIVERWFNICCRVGLAKPEDKAAFFKHAVQITDNCRTSEYLAKQDDSKNWGVDREIAKGASKQSMKSKGRHPFSLLEDFENGDKQSGALYLEFLDAMRRKTPVRWSAGLKKLVGLDEITDEEIAEKQDDNADLLALLSAKDWSVVIRNDAKAKILDIAEDLGAEGLQKWLVEHSEKLAIVEDTSEKDSESKARLNQTLAKTIAKDRDLLILCSQASLGLFSDDLQNYSP